MFHAFKSDDDDMETITTTTTGDDDDDDDDDDAFNLARPADERMYSRSSSGFAFYQFGQENRTGIGHFHAGGVRRIDGPDI